MNKSGNPRSCAKLKSATAKAEFNDERRALRRVLQPTQAHAWRIYPLALTETDPPVLTGIDPVTMAGDGGMRR